MFSELNKSNSRLSFRGSHGVLDRAILGDECTRGSGRDNRMFVEAVLWIVCAGSPWRNHEVFGGAEQCLPARFSRCSRKGV